MVHNVFSLHKIAAAEDVIFPIPIKDYQRYIFGDDRLAHRFGTDLAKAFVAQGPGSASAAAHATSTLSNGTGHNNDYAVAIVSSNVPTATVSLRNHFVANLNRHLVATNAKPATKIDLFPHHENGNDSKSSPQGYHLDAKALGSKTLIVLADIRTTAALETAISNSLTSAKVANSIIFAYILSVTSPTTSLINSLSPIMAHVISPSLKEIEHIAQSKDFALNECFVQWVLGREYAEFCQFVRRQDDGFVRKLLEYAICGGFYSEGEFEGNVAFLRWEIEARESV